MAVRPGLCKYTQVGLYKIRFTLTNSSNSGFNAGFGSGYGQQLVYAAEP